MVFYIPVILFLIYRLFKRKSPVTGSLLVLAILSGANYMGFTGQLIDPLPYVIYGVSALAVLAFSILSTRERKKITRDLLKYRRMEREIQRENEKDDADRERLIVKHADNRSEKTFYIRRKKEESIDVEEKSASRDKNVPHGTSLENRDEKEYSFDRDRADESLKSDKKKIFEKDENLPKESVGEELEKTTKREKTSEERSARGQDSIRSTEEKFDLSKKSSKRIFSNEDSLDLAEKSSEKKTEDKNVPHGTSKSEETIDAEKSKNDQKVDRENFEASKDKKSRIRPAPDGDGKTFYLFREDEEQISDSDQHGENTTESSRRKDLKNKRNRTGVLRRIKRKEAKDKNKNK